MNVAILTTEQKNILTGNLFNLDSSFNPIQDINDNWVISEEEINQCIFEEYNWIKDLELIEFNSKVSTFFNI